MAVKQNELTEIKFRNIMFASCTPFWRSNEIACTAEFPTMEKWCSIRIMKRHMQINWFPS